MSRFVLAILALFAGLAAQVSPAEARLRGATEIGAVAGQRGIARAAVVQAAAAILPETRRETRGAEAAGRALPRLILASQAVHIGPDRAHE
jgi:hypothetical protein